MCRVLRLFLAVFLAFAVPLQGLAGTTMAACGAAHGNRAAHDGHDMAMDHGAMDHGAMGHDVHPAADSGPVHETHDCAACAACCSLSAAPAPALLVQGANPAPSIVIPFLEVARASFAPEGLERPPSLLAL